MSERIKVTCTFEITPESLEEWEATSVEEAAQNLREWYEDGSAALIDDLACANDLSVQIEVIS